MPKVAQAFASGLVLVAIAAGVGLAGDDVKAEFGEEGVLTWFSALLLLGTAWTAWLVFRRRGGTLHTGIWRDARFLWALIAAAFVFLAADETLKIHETADHAIHRALDFEETRMSDRIDDAIVGVYGVLALIVLAAYRRELSVVRPLAPFLVVALFCFFGMVAGDLLTSTHEVWLPGRVRLSLVEDGLKVIAECLFLAGFHDAWRALAPGSMAADLSL